MINRLLTAAACAALLAGAAGAAQAQTAAQSAPSAAAPAAPAPSAAPAPAAGYTRIAPAGDIVQTLQASGQFKTLIKALDATNLTAVLKQQPHLTVFAPTDAAFAAYGDTTKLLADLPTLQKLLLHHVINAEVDTSKFKGAHGPVATGAGDKVVLDGVGDTFKADQANILQADVRASNGLIDVVDQVLKAGSVPETIAEAAAPAEEKPAAEAAKPAPAKKATTKGTKRGHK